MPKKSKAELEQLYDDYSTVRSEYNELREANPKSGKNQEKLPEMIMSAFFDRKEVAALAEALDTDYIKVFLIKKPADAAGEVHLSMAMAGINVDEKTAKTVFADLGGATNQGIEATEECPPYCDGPKTSVRS